MSTKISPFEPVEELLENYGNKYGTEAQLNKTTNLLRDLFYLAPEKTRRRWLQEHDLPQHKSI